MAEYDASDPVQVKERRRRLKVIEKQRGDYIRSVMNVRQGRAWLYEILEMCHVFKTSFSSDAATMAFSEGERNVGLKMMADIMQHAPDMYAMMLKEAEEKEDGGSSSDASAG